MRRARKIKKGISNVKYFDLHCDTLTKCRENREELKNAKLSVNLEKGKKYVSWAQVFAIWIDDSLRGKEAYGFFSRNAGFFAEQMEKNSGTISFCRSSGDMRKAAENSKEIALLSIEGSGALAGRIENLYNAYKAGVRLITLTWNGKCEAGDGCMVENAGGLTPFGLDLVCKMEQLGIIVDVSHLSEKGFWDVARTAKRPFVASHSDSKGVFDCRRNLTDDQFREIVKGGGLVGLNFCRGFLAGGRVTVEDIIRHADHYLHIGGEKALALGSDFDGCALPDGIHGTEDVANIHSAFCKEFGSELADAVFYGNAFRFFTENL